MRTRTLFLLVVGDVGVELNDVFVASDVDRKLSSLMFEIFEDAVDFRNHVDGAVGGDAEEHVAALQFQCVFHVDETGERNRAR